MGQKLFDNDLLVRPGYVLVSIAQVALPVYQVNAEVLTLTQQILDPVEEYVLKSIKAGVNRVSDISDFLGIEERLLVTVLADMLRMGYVRESAGSNQVLIAPLGAELL